jgi:hypothetical protein
MAEELGIFRQREAGQIDPEHVRQEIELEMKLPPPGGQGAGVLTGARVSAQLAKLRALLAEQRPAEAPADGKFEKCESVGSEINERGDS